MITDRIQITGIGAYLQDPANPGSINLGQVAPVVIRTQPLNKGRQLEISGLQLLIEGDDLAPFFRFQFDGSNDPAPLLQLHIMKEMFAGLFADPFRHKVHNVAGYLDFNEGTLTNGRVMDIDGVPTIVSIGKDECKWVSREYFLPDPVTIDAVAWELATSKLTPANSFNYKLQIKFNDAAGNPVGTISTGPAFIGADVPRALELSGANLIRNASSFQITFRAKVQQDSFLTERHLPFPTENLGRPLLRAVNILELLNASVYDIHSLTELQSLCSEFQLSETPGPEITRLIALLDFDAVLVNSGNQQIVNSDIYDAASRFEYIEVNLLTNKFTWFEAKLEGEELIREYGSGNS